MGSPPAKHDECGSKIITENAQKHVSLPKDNLTYERGEIQRSFSEGM